MAKIIDYLSLSVIMFLLTMVWSSIAFNSLAGALIFSAALSIAVTFGIRYFSKCKSRPYGYDRLALQLSTEGSEYLIDLIKSIIKNDDIESGSNYILLDDCILIAAFRFNILGINDLGTIYRQCVKHGKKRVYIMARGIDRRAYQAFLLKDISVSLIRIRQIYSFLKRNNALPDLTPVKRKFSLSYFTEAIFQRSNLKNYLFTGIILISAAFITPLRIYYLVFGSISLMLALITLSPIGKGHIRSSGIFDRLEELKKDNGAPDDSQK